MQKKIAFFCGNALFTRYMLHVSIHISISVKHHEHELCVLHVIVTH